MMQPTRQSGPFAAEAELFGSHLTCGFIAPEGDSMAGIHVARGVFVVKGMYSGLRRSFAAKSRNESE
eukprot:7641665-Alexandrium_andersonii.AAC.1